MSENLAPAFCRRALTSSTTSNLRSSGQSKRSSGVLTGCGRPSRMSARLCLALATMLSSRSAAIERVVEAVEGVGEEDVAAHLAGERRADLGHLALDQRMAGLEHHRLAAGARDLVEQHLACLDVGDDGGAGMASSARRAPTAPAAGRPTGCGPCRRSRRCGRHRRRRRCRGRSRRCFTSAISCARFSGTVGSGWCAGKVPSTFSFSTKCSPGSLSTTARIDTPTAPLPVSQATLSFLPGFTSCRSRAA